MRCEKHDVALETVEADRGKTLQRCPECHKEQRASEASMFAAFQKGAAALLFALLAGPALAQEPFDGAIPTPGPTPAPATFTILAGGLVTLGNGAEAPALTPTARIAASFPVSSCAACLAPYVHVQADFSALPGEAVEVTDPTTFRALQFTVGASQRLSRSINAALYAQAGFATRLGVDPAPRDRAPRYWSAGLRFAGDRGWLQLGLGMDQRLGGDLYQPAATVAGAVRLYAQESGPLAGGAVFLVGEAVLGLDLSSRFAGRDGGKGDSVRVGVAVGGGR